jgi:predicted ATPase/DNA-binding SARP family transcriptional activator
MLGPLEVRDSAGAVLGVGGARLRGLLIMLALRPGQLVTSSQLIEGLWGEQPPAEPGNALQALVSRLRRAVPEAEIESRAAGYRLVLDPEATDVARFERLAAAGHTRLRDDPAQAAKVLREALALWRGPALADAAETEGAGGTGVQAVVARLDELRLGATQDRVTADLQLGRAREVIAELEGLTAAYPTREPLAGLLMRALRASGQRNAALEVYERTRRRLADQLGTDPSAELAALHLELLQAEQPAPASRLELPESGRPAPASADLGGAGLASAGLASAGLGGAGLGGAGLGGAGLGGVDVGGVGGADDAGMDAPSTNLPVTLTSFVGRDDELSQVAGLLTVHRLVTLIGPGGAGKTRLAIETATRQKARDGVWLVELAAVTDPAEVAQAVLTTLGLREKSVLRATEVARTAEPAGRLVSALAGKRVLVVLDNCEHLIGTVAALAHAILTASPEIRILATSREPLNINGEALLPVGPLAIKPATRLLEERALAVSPSFVTSPVVTEIARALDGMPLAIELAAARIRTMGPDQVARRLDDRFRLLTGGSRTAMPRHQTLRAVVDWSWDLLDDAERALWRRLSVFTGGATLDAVEQVCAGGPVKQADVVDLLAALADKSVVTIRPGPRYSMLEIIRAYGEERLAEAGETEELRRGHIGYFLRMADESQDYLLGAQQLDWLHRLSEDQENLHAAVRAAVAAQDADAAVALAGSLGWYWWLRSMKGEGADLCGEALAMAGRVADTERLAIAYLMGGMLAFFTARFENSVRWLHQATELAGQTPEPRNPAVRLARPLSVLFTGWQAIAEQPQEVEDIIDDPDPWVSAVARIIRGQIGINSGSRLAEAAADFRAAAATFEALGERWGGAAALGGGLAMLEAWSGDFAASIGHYERAVTLAAELGAAVDEGQLRLMLARVLWADGQRDRAAAELDQALRDALRIGWPESRSFAACIAGDLARLDGQIGIAREHLQLARELADVPDMAAQQRAVVSTALAFVASAEGDSDTARRLHEEAYQLALPTSDAPVIARALIGLADQALRDGDHGRASGLLTESISVRGSTDRSDVDEQRLCAALEGAYGERREDGGYGHRVQE